MILYLHGFRSAPQSYKARRLEAHLAIRGRAGEFCCPLLPASPRQAITLAAGLIRNHPGPVTVIGSSLGGYYATWLADTLPDQVRGVVLINPSVVAHVSLQDYLGPQINLHTGEHFEFTRDHIADLAALEIPRPTGLDRYWLLAETGDEVLDYRHAVQKYAGARQTILPGGDHSFTRWDDFLDDVIAFSDTAHVHPV